jgi:hypothetical protein
VEHVEGAATDLEAAARACRCSSLSAAASCSILDRSASSRTTCTHPDVSVAAAAQACLGALQHHSSVL